MGRSGFLVFMVLSSCATVIAGCGDDNAPATDSGTPGTDGSAADAGSGTDGGGGLCAEDGTSCGSAMVCSGGECVESVCGDGLIDTASGEQCDDMNDVAGDGCQPSDCSFTCEEAADCTDDDPCNGEEVCLPDIHRCQLGTEPADTTMCALPEDPDGEATGVCGGGYCVPAGCGNGVVDGGEDCDDSMNGDNTDGCRDDCHYTCSEEIDCQDGDACNGTETCNPTSHTCEAGTAPDCDDMDACTRDGCDAATGCTNELIDGDMDGYSPRTCAAGSMFMGGDCDDRNDTVYPGAPELCDRINNDCDDLTDEDVVTFTCYRDQDDDGYGDATMSMADQCSCPSGYIPPRSDGLYDCYDANADVHPNQNTYFEDGYRCLRRLISPPICLDLDFDYNCADGETQLYTGVNTTTSSCRITGGGRFQICTGSGWTGATAPICGVEAEFISCAWGYNRFGTYGCYGTTVASKAQSCH